MKQNEDHIQYWGYKYYVPISYKLIILFRKGHVV